MTESEVNAGLEFGVSGGESTWVGELGCSNVATLVRSVGLSESWTLRSGYGIVAAARRESRMSEISSLMYVDTWDLGWDKQIRHRPRELQGFTSWEYRKNFWSNVENKASWSSNVPQLIGSSWQSLKQYWITILVDTMLSCKALQGKNSDPLVSCHRGTSTHNHRARLAQHHMDLCACSVVIGTGSSISLVPVPSTWTSSNGNEVAKKLVNCTTYIVATLWESVTQGTQDRIASLRNRGFSKSHSRQTQVYLVITDYLVSDS